MNILYDVVPKVYDIAEVERDCVELYSVQLLLVLQLLSSEIIRNEIFGLDFVILYNISYFR